MKPDVKPSLDPVNTYLHMINRMEPDLYFIDSCAGWASIAVSLRRIADSLEIISKQFNLEK